LKRKRKRDKENRRSTNTTPLGFLKDWKVWNFESKRSQKKRINNALLHNFCTFYIIVMIFVFFNILDLLFKLGDFIIFVFVVFFLFVQKLGLMIAWLEKPKARQTKLKGGLKSVCAAVCPSVCMSDANGQTPYLVLLANSVGDRRYLCKMCFIRCEKVARKIRRIQLLKQAKRVGTKRDCWIFSSSWFALILFFSFFFFLVRCIVPWRKAATEKEEEKIN
jgi:amino acid transporter